MGTYGQFAGGGFAGDENLPTGSATPPGLRDLRHRRVHGQPRAADPVTGDPLWADRCEELAQHCCPPRLDPASKSTHYITSANSVDLNNTPKSQAQFQNGFAMQAYMAGVDQYRCRPHNYGYGWPYFTEELWLATPDKGLAAAMYAPCSVTAKVADGTSVTITETTTYPFSDTITLSISTPKALAFPVYLRVPGWCSAPSIAVNGAAVSAPAGPAFAIVNRTWSNGDTVTIQLPSQVSVRTWASNKSSVSVYRGPLAYSLQIGENFVQTGGSTEFPQYEVHATTAWNYGLALPTSNPASALTFHNSGSGLAANAFTQGGNPLTITAPAQPVANWRADDENVVGTLQTSPTVSSEIRPRSL